MQSNYEWVPADDNKTLYVYTQKMPFAYDTEGNVGILGITRDITELHQAQERLEKLSFLDELTKLGNRKAYNKDLAMALATFKRYQTPFSLMMMDIDDFKVVNDTYGHIVGDSVLIQLSELLKANTRENDYAYRIGGEEFMILLPEATLKEAETVADKLREMVANKLNAVSGYAVTISAGVVQVSEIDTADSIFKRVDALLYKAKDMGKNEVRSLLD